MLFAPKCSACKDFIRGKVIKAINGNFHPDCFNCAICAANLTDQGFIKNGTLALCHRCNSSIKSGACPKAICSECSSLIEESELLRHKEATYHAYHFSCSGCGAELTKDARERKGELYCLRCNDKMGVPVCAACHKPIDQDKERVISALGRNWHNEHFACCKCGKPFMGSRFMERKGLPYCEIDYHHLFGNSCFVCSKVITSDSFTALNKSWCKDHFVCGFCDGKLSQKDKFYDVDLKPCCKKCFDKFPSELRKRLKNYYNGKKKS